MEKSKNMDFRNGFVLGIIVSIIFIKLDYKRIKNKIIEIKNNISNTKDSNDNDIRRGYTKVRSEDE